MFDIFGVDGEIYFEIDDLKKDLDSSSIKKAALRINIDEENIIIFCVVKLKENIIFNVITNLNLDNKSKQIFEIRFEEIIKQMDWINIKEFKLLSPRFKSNIKKVENSKSKMEAFLKASSILFKKIAFDILENKNIFSIKIINARDESMAKKEAKVISKYIKNTKFENALSYIDSLLLCLENPNIKIFLHGKIVYENRSIFNEKFMNKIMQNYRNLNLCFDYGYASGGTYTAYEAI